MLQVKARKQRGNFTLDVELQTPTPGVVALFGRSGCGKSTLTNIIAGLLSADDGLIELHGSKLLDWPARFSLPVAQRRIGYVFQDARLFPHYDVRGNLMYGAKRARVPQFITADETIALLGLEPLLARKPQQLSGGEKQRVALGRALLSQPQLLLLDEPLASLDVARREEVLPYLEKLRDRLAIPMVYVSHQFDEVLRLATQVVVLDQGRVLVQGDIGVVSAHPALRAIVGADSIGAVVDGHVITNHDQSGLADITVGNGVLRIYTHANVGTRVRIQILARDVILATRPPEGLSVRNALLGNIARIEPDEHFTDLVFVNVGDATIMARITRVATDALRLNVGQPIWALVKAVSLRGHAFS